MLLSNQRYQQPDRTGQSAAKDAVLFLFSVFEHLGFVESGTPKSTTAGLYHIEISNDKFLSSNKTDEECFSLFFV